MLVSLLRCPDLPFSLVSVNETVKNPVDKFRDGL
jgi:hypothetical protein